MQSKCTQKEKKTLTLYSCKTNTTKVIIGIAIEVWHIISVNGVKGMQTIIVIYS